MDVLTRKQIAAREPRLFSGTRVLAPEDLGRRDVLVAGGKVLAILEPGEPVQLGDGEVQRIEAEGRVLMPAVVDIHCHVAGGGGWGGPATQCDPIDKAELVRAGIGTVVGLLGYGTATRRPEALLGRIRSLRESGFNSFMYSGEIAWPPVTITGEIGRDIALIPEVRGAKAAIADHDAGIITVERLMDLAGQVLQGSRTAGKTPVLHLHVGRADQRFEVIRKAIDDDLLDPGMITLTHVNWSKEIAREAAELAQAGVNVDLTCCIRPDYFPGSISPAEGFYELLDAGAPLERITASSDAGGSHVDQETGSTVVHPPSLLFGTLAQIVRDGETDFQDAISVFTSNAAERLGLRDAGRIAPGGRADLILTEPDLSLGQLYLAGEPVGEVRP